MKYDVLLCTRGPGRRPTPNGLLAVSYFSVPAVLVARRCPQPAESVFSARRNREADRTKGARARKREQWNFDFVDGKPRATILDGRETATVRWTDKTEFCIFCFFENDLSSFE